MADSSGSGSRKLACFIEEDDGLASLVDMEAGFSGNQPSTNNNNNIHHYHPFFSRSLRYGKKNSVRAISSSSTSPSSSSSSFVPFSPRSVRFYDARFEDHHHHHQQPHFLYSCFLCKKPLGDNRDIFMYRGDTPFCSEECRQEQIEMDEAKEKKWSSSSIKGLKKKDQNKSSISPTKSQNYPSRAGTVAAA